MPAPTTTDNNQPATGNQPVINVTIPSSEEIASRWREQSGGNERAALRRAGKDNQKLRRKLAATNQELEGYKTRNPQGSLVLNGDDVTVWNALKPVVGDLKGKNIKVEDLPKLLKEREDLLAKKSKDETKSTARKAGESLGLKGDSLETFEELIADKNLVLEEKDITVVKGKKAITKKAWHAKPAGDDKATPVLIEDFKGLKPYLKALRAASSEEEGDDGDEEEDTLSSTSRKESDDESDEDDEDVVRTTIPEQRTSGKSRSTKKDLVGRFMKDQYPLPGEEKKGEGRE